MLPNKTSLFVIIVLLAGLIGAPPPGAAAPSSPSGRIVVALGSTQTTLDTTLEYGSPILNPAIHLFDFLVWRDASMGIRPMLATSWSFPTPTTLRVELRQGVRFHNGDPLTTEDVVYTIKRVLNPAVRSRQRSFFESVTDIRAVDAGTIDLLLKNPDPYLLTRLTVVGIIPKKYVETAGEDAWQSKPIGTGPYKLKEWIKGQRIVLEANPNYWGPRPYIQTIIYRSILNDRTRMAALKTGDVDIAVNVPPDETAYVRSSPNTDLLTVQSLRSLFLVLNTKKSPLSDVRVRQALAHAIDKNLLAKAVLQGYAVPIKLPWGPQVSGYDANVPAYDYNVDKAKALLREASFPSGFTLKMVAPTGRYLAGNETALAIAGQWEKIGVKTTVSFLEFEFWLSTYLRKYQPDMDVNLVGNANATADAYHNLVTNFNSKVQGQFWYNAEVEDLTERAGRTLDGAQRLQFFGRIDGTLVRELPVIPLWDFVDVYGVRKRVQEFKPRADEIIDLRRVWAK